MCISSRSTCLEAVDLSVMCPININREPKCLERLAIPFNRCYVLSPEFEGKLGGAWVTVFILSNVINAALE